MSRTVRLSLALLMPTLLWSCDGTPGTPGIGGLTRAILPGGAAISAPVLLEVERGIREGDLSVEPGAPGDALTRRVAVVIGNSNYASITSLGNPRRDAAAMAGFLRGQGFHVIEGIDLTKRQFEKLLRDAVMVGGPEAEVLVFYAGHGFQIADRNFLVPVDADLAVPEDLPFNTVRLRSILRLLRDRSDRNITFIDACRNNPFPGQQGTTGVRGNGAPTEEGFSEPAVPRGGLVAYATQPGALAYDGEGEPNSPYTAALLRNAGRRPDADITSTLRRVRREVSAATGGDQVPTWRSALDGVFTLKPLEEKLAEIPAPPPGLAPTPVVVAATPDATPGITPDATPDTPTGTAPAPTPAAPVGAPVPGGRPAAIAVVAPLEQVVAVGSRISEALELPPGATVTVLEADAAGDLATISADGMLITAEPEDVPREDLGAVVYTLSPDQRPAPFRIQDAILTEEYVAEITIPGAAPQSVAVSLNLVPDACDFQAGEWFDIQGVGLYQEGGIASPRAAVIACAEAVERDPQNGRFRYQLAKALEAFGEPRQALDHYRRAARLGHLRAWVALGRLAIERGEATTVAMGYFQQAADGGDPFGVMELGILKLNTGGTLAEREEGYDLLGYAVDLGLVRAMEALAIYYSDPGSPEYDPERGQIYDDEAKARRPATRYRPNEGPAEIEGGGDGGDSDSGSGTGSP